MGELNRKFVAGTYETLRHRKDRDAALLALLTKETWAKKSDRLVYLSGLTKLFARNGVPYPFENSLEFGNPDEIARFKRELFENTLKTILPDLIATVRLPFTLKILVIDELEKFLEINNLPESFQDALSKTRRTLESKRLSSEPSSRPRRAPINLIKRILRCDCLGKPIKMVFMDYLLKDLALKPCQNEFVLRIPLSGIDEAVAKRLFFSSGVPANRQYTQFKKNILFTYFSFVYALAKYERKAFEIRYHRPVLEHIANLCLGDFCRGLPVTVDADYLKSFIKDFYNENSKNESSHQVNP